MGRNKNKDRDGCATVPSSNRKKDRTDDYCSESDDSISTHLTFDDDMRSVQGDVENDDEALFDSLSEHIENAANKNVNVRVAALRHLQFALTSQYLGEIVVKWRSTLIDLIAKGLKKTDDELIVCASLLALVAVQVGEEISGDVEDPLTTLRVFVTDPTRSEVIRAHCALVLSLTTYIASESDDSVELGIKALRQAWASQKANSTSYRLFSMALAGWSLLLQNTENNCLNSSFDDESKLVQYLEANALEVRLAAGEALAFMYELDDDRRCGHKFNHHTHVVNLLGALATDSTKAKTKRDKRVQKFTFRQLYSCVANGEIPEIKIKFTNLETLVLDSCSSKLLYDLLIEILHGGMMRQLKDNSLLREVFGLGAPTRIKEKRNKAARMAYHDAADKYRNQQRGKQRDKRAAIY